MTESLDRYQNISYAQAVYRRAGKEKIEAFKVQQLVKIITTVIWEINRKEFDFIDQMLIE